MRISPIRILLIEDNKGDTLVTSEALEKGKILKSIKVIRDGASALLYLLETVEKSPYDLPDLILLEISPAKKNVRELLMEVKSNSSLRYIPVIILTTSSISSKIQKCYREQANCYLIKPIEVSDFPKVVEKIEDFWLNSFIYQNELTQ